VHNGLDLDHYQYTHDTQLFMSIKASLMTADRLPFVRRLFRCDLLRMNYFSTLIGRSHVMFIGTFAEPCTANNVASVVVAGIVIDSWLTVATHVLAVQSACNYQIGVLRYNTLSTITLDVAKFKKSFKSLIFRFAIATLPEKPQRPVLTVLSDRHASI